MDSDSSSAERLEWAREVIWEAGRFTLAHFRSADLTVDRKQDATPVTDADRGAERFLREKIAESFPDDGILGEEFGETAGAAAQDAEFRWILDPIDGTKSFISGVPLYSTLIGIERRGQPEIGLILVPALGECVYARRGGGAWYQAAEGQTPVAAQVLSRPLSEGVFVTSQVDGFSERGAMEIYHQLEHRASITRTWGDGYGYLLVATGRADLMVDPGMNIWDAAAIAPVIDEAGGVFCDWNGDRRIDSGDGIGCTRQVLDDVLTLTRRGGVAGN